MNKHAQNSQPRFGEMSELDKSDDGLVHVNAIFSTYKRKPNSGVFDGGKIDAIVGGVELDLCQATMKHDTARINIFALFGGVVILVPKEWNVSVQVSAIVGGVDDQTVPQPEGDSLRPKLVVTGTVILGGVVVK